MTRSLNKVTLIGNLTRDPELRYTPAGTAVCTFGLATNRQWTTESGEKKEDVEFHRIVAWQKLAELCSQLLNKGRKVYVEGRLQTRKWKGQDEVEKTTTEVIITDMIILDNKGQAVGGESLEDIPDDLGADFDSFATDSGANTKQSNSGQTSKSKANKQSDKLEKEEVVDEDIPF